MHYLLAKLPLIEFKIPKINHCAINQIMLDHQPLIQNYANILFTGAFTEQMADKILGQMMIIDQAINLDQQVKSFMSSPIIRQIDKITVLTRLIKKFNLEKIVQQFLHLLVKNGRMSSLTKIVLCGNQLLCQRRNIKIIEVASARKLNLSEEKWFQAWLKKHIQPEIMVRFSQDQSIIGGVIIRYDSKLMDYSISGALKKIQRTVKNLKILAVSKN